MPPTTPSAIPFPEALALVLREAAALRPDPQPETLPLLAAQNRILAEALLADRDQPPFDRSTRDGFAVHLAHSGEPPTWRVLGQIFAGETWPGPAPERGEAVEIMTGAPVPDGAHAVVMLEHVTDSANPQHPVSASPIFPSSDPHTPAATDAVSRVPGRTITLAPGRSIAPGANIVPRAREAAAGSVILPPGTALGPAEIALAASAGITSARVFRRPRVAIISTGDELVELVELVEPAPTPHPASPAIAPHQIRNSNSYALAALVAETGGEPWRLPIARDTPESLRAIIATALAEADLILLTGGVSMGKRDLVEDVLHSFGARFHFTGVLMQPGKPVVFGSIPQTGTPVDAARLSSPARLPASETTPRTREAGTIPRTPAIPLFGLPGNPISTEVTFRCFVAPVLRALAGEPHPQPRFALARLAEDAPGNPDLTRLLPARLESLTPSAAPDPRVALVPWQGSGDLAGNARANCYALLPPGRDRFTTGDLVSVLLR